MSNVIVIACSMNYGYNYVYYPANHPNVIAVGGTDKNNRRASFAQYGQNLDVVAPAVDIYSTALNNNYNSQDGTSFSAPQVAGVAALILSVRPDLTGQQVRNVIEQTAQKVGGYSYVTTSGRPNGTWNQEMGYGLVDAYAAVYAVTSRISGPVNVCDQATYTLENAPRGIPFGWSVSQDMMIVSETDSNITVRRNPNLSCMNSSAYVIADIGAPINELIENNRIIVWKGGINETNGLISITPPPDEYNPEGYYIAQLKGDLLYSGIQGLNWSAGGLEIIFQDGTLAYFHGRLHNGTYIAAHFQNPCGGETDIIHRFSGERGYTFTLSPNPASDTVTLTFREQDGEERERVSTATGNGSESAVYQIQLWSMGGMLLKQYKSNRRSFQIHIGDLPKGVYMVHVIKNGERCTKKLIKE